MDKNTDLQCHNELRFALQWKHQSVMGTSLALTLLVTGDFFFGEGVEVSWVPPTLY